MRSKFVLRAAGTRQGGRNKMATTRQQPAVWIGGRWRRRRDEKRPVWGAAGGSDRLRWVEAVMCEQAGMWARLGGGKGRRARATNLAKMRSVARWTWVAMDAAGSIGMILKAASAAAVAVEAMAGKQVAVRVEAVVRSGRMARAAANEATVAADRAGQAVRAAAVAGRRSCSYSLGWWQWLERRRAIE